MKQLGNPTGDPRPIPTREFRCHGYIVRDRQMREQSNLLEHVADAASTRDPGREVAHSGENDLADIR